MLRQIGRKLELAGRWAQSRVRSRSYTGTFDAVERYCMFLGQPRSGHSLTGALLDAHPEVVVAHELHALRYVRYGFNRDQLYWLLLQNSRDFARRGRPSAGYSYAVPHQWQGGFRRLRVIGDKRGGTSVRKLQRHPDLLHRLRDIVRVPIRFIHVVRNPYDNIATMHLKGRKPSLERSIDHYVGMAEGFARLRRELPRGELIEMRHEAFVADPARELKRLCEFVGVEALEDYVADCSSILFSAPRRTRDGAPWTPALRERVAKEIAHHPSLSGYRFED